VRSHLNRHENFSVLGDGQFVREGAGKAGGEVGDAVIGEGEDVEVVISGGRVIPGLG
jgi:hypothetical protein